MSAIIMATNDTTISGRGHSANPYAEIPIEFYPAYIAYFHALACSGVGFPAFNTSGTYTIELCEIDRRCNDNMDHVNSVTLVYREEK